MRCGVALANPGKTVAVRGLPKGGEPATVPPVVTMNAIPQRKAATVEEYLAAEAASPVKHEFLGGEIVAMSGASRPHNVISLNIAAELRAVLRDGPCQAHMADVKLRLDFARDTSFYYPDVLVTCSPRDTEHLYVTEPCVIFEVLSPETQRVDRQEKRLAYQQIPTLEDYVIVAQDFVEVTVYRRSLGWSGQVFTRLDDTLDLPSLKVKLPVTAIYERVPLLGGSSAGASASAKPSRRAPATPRSRTTRRKRA